MPKKALPQYRPKPPNMARRRTSPSSASWSSTKSTNESFTLASSKDAARQTPAPAPHHVARATTAPVSMKLLPAKALDLQPLSAVAKVSNPGETGLVEADPRSPVCPRVTDRRECG